MQQAVALGMTEPQTAEEAFNSTKASAPQSASRRSCEAAYGVKVKFWRRLKTFHKSKDYDDYDMMIIIINNNYSTSSSSKELSNHKLYSRLRSLSAESILFEYRPN